jgi:acyl-coenzyme A thioesterase PaaI-like protein
MKKDFEQLSIKPGFMKHNGGLFYRQISETESEFKASVDEYHLNAAGITHGGYIALIIDAGAGTGAHRTADGGSCVTVSLDIKFIGTTKLGDEIKGFTKIQKKTKKYDFFNLLS